MLGGLALILTCQLVGEFVTRTTHLPVPGAVVGMVLFFAYLSVRRPAPNSGEIRASDALLTMLPMFFVPAGIGIVVYLPILAANALPLGVGLVASWLAGLLATAGVALLLRPRQSPAGDAA